jgi:hypothetical protein
MHRLLSCAALGALVIGTLAAPLGSADARRRVSPRPPVVVYPYWRYGPPPPISSNRSPYSPPPAIRAPMPRVQQPAPLAQPPINR